MSFRRSILNYVSSQETERIFAGGTGYGVATGSGTTAQIAVGGLNYTLLSFLSDGTIVVTQPGLFDVLAVGGGGASGNCYYYNPSPSHHYPSSGGGGGGVIGLTETLTLFLEAGTYDVDCGIGGYPNHPTDYQMSGSPGRPTRLYKSTLPSTHIFEVLGGGGGSGGFHPNSSNYAYAQGQEGAHGGGSSYSNEPHIGESLSFERNPNPQFYPYNGSTYMGGGRRAGWGGMNGQNGNAGGAGAGAGGSATAGQWNLGATGGNGVDISSWTSGGIFYVGAGGSGGCWGGSVGAASLGGVAGGSTNPNPGVQPGAGAGGCGQGNRTGGFGAPGAMWIRFRI
jgi:hypothetical protein